MMYVLPCDSVHFAFAFWVSQFMVSVSLNLHSLAVFAALFQKQGRCLESYNPTSR